MAKRKRVQCSSGDFSSSLLPNTRRKQFFDCLKNRWGLFLEVGAFFALASLLFVGLIYAQDLVTHNIANDASLEEGARNAQLNSMGMVFASLCGALILLATLPLGGFLRIYRSLIHDEGVFFFSDFFKGFKETWKVSLLLGFMLGGGYFACAFYKSLIPVPFLSYAPYGVLLFLVLPCSFTTLSYASFYRSAFSVTLQNGFVLTVKSFGKDLLLVLFFLLPFLFLLLPSSFRYIPLILCFLAYYPVLLFAAYLVSIACFDEQINAKVANGLYHKGLSDAEAEEDE